MAVSRSSKPRLRIIAAFALIGSFVLAATFFELHDWGTEPVSRDDGEALLEQAVELAQAGDLDGLCQTVSVAPDMCSSQLGWAYPAPTVPRVVDARQVREDLIVLRVQGALQDGSSYVSDFPVTHDDNGELRSSNAVYWSGFTFHDPSLRCLEEAGHSFCAGVPVTPPR